MKAKNLKIREILAANAQKTVEVELETAKGKVRSSIPIGTSRGKYEVVSLPTESVIRKFLIIKRHFLTEDFENQEDVDSLLRLIDKTPNFRDIGGNLALAISSAFFKAFALENDKEIFEFLLKEKPFMPRPICNVIGGWAGTMTSDIQEFLLLPVHQKSFANTVAKIASIYKGLARELKEKDPKFLFSKNIEDAWVTTLPLEVTLKILKKVADDNLLKIGLDFAASQMWNGKSYQYANSKVVFNQTEQILFVEDLAKRYPILYIEDPFHEDDFISFSTLTHMLPSKLIVGDDLYATNLERLNAGIKEKATNSIIIKPNQVGTITDVIKVVEEAKKNRFITVMSHRSGETEDTLMCHLAVGLGCEYVKLGIGGERAVKINEIIRIEEKLKS